LKLEKRAFFKPDLRFLCSKNYPRNINYMSAVIFWASLDFEKNCYSRTASWFSISGVESPMVCIPALERWNKKRSNY